MSKRDRGFLSIDEFKQRFSSLPTATLISRANKGVLYKEASIAIRQLLDERTKSGEITTIFIALKDEGTDVWRPVQAASLGADLYRVLSANDNPDDEHWEFASGAIVRCQESAFASGGSGLVAIEAVWIAGSDGTGENT